MAGNYFLLSLSWFVCRQVRDSFRLVGKCNYTLSYMVQLILEGAKRNMQEHARMEAKNGSQECRLTFGSPSSMVVKKRSS